VQLPEIDHHVDALSDLVASLDVSTLSGEEAANLVESLSRLEKIAGAAKGLCASRVAATGWHEREGARDAATWLAGISGDSRSAAGDLLDTAAQLENLSKLDDAFRRGELSGKQAHEIARAGALDPSAEDSLLQAARTTTLGGLREAADKVVSAARSKEEDEERHRRVHEERHLRTWTKDGAFQGQFSLTPEAGAKLMGPLSMLADEIFEQAWREGRVESHGAYLADALVCLASCEGLHLLSPSTGTASVEPGDTGDAAEQAPPAPLATASPLPGPCCRHQDCTIIMRVDLEALVRGHLLPGEESSIDGVGHVPLTVVQQYLDAAKVRLVVTEGVDIRSVYSFKRNIPKALDIALRHRDRQCAVDRCGATFQLERDHIHEFARGGPTTLDNLVLLCGYHHRLKTSKGYRIEGSPGDWRWLHPDGTPAEAFETQVEAA